MSFTLAIVGRPNVGKSTLFNRLVGRRLALVDDQPGVTRDLREGDARLGPLKFVVIDTAGLEEATDESLQGRMRALTERAVDMADVCLFMIDARVGVTPADQFFAEILRKKGKRVIVVANKSEGRAGEEGFYDAFSLGLGEPVRVSAEHGEGMFDLQTVLAPIAEEFKDRDYEPLTDVSFEEGEEDEEITFSEKRPLQIAVVGRPNAGKSTLINKILGQDRLLTGPEAGITRDAISINHVWDGVPLRIWDTAGIRKKAKVQEKLEKLSVSDGLRAVKFSEVVVVLLDAEIPFEQQDLRIADLAEREGRAVVIAVNKWDVETDRPAAAAARCASGHRVGSHRSRSGPLARGDPQGACHMEPPDTHGAAEPLAVRHDGNAPATRTGRAAHPFAVHYTGEVAPADLCGDVLAPRIAAHQLYPLPDQRFAGPF